MEENIRARDFSPPERNSSRTLRPYRRLCPPPRGGGGGYFHNFFMYAYWVCAANETPIFSHEFPFRSISFSQITKKSVPEHHHFTFFGGFCRSGDHHFQNFFNFNPFIASHGRGSARSAAPRLSGCSGDSHFQAFGSAAG